MTRGVRGTRSGYMDASGKRITKRQAMAKMKLIVEGKLDDPKRRAIIDRNLDADMARIKKQVAYFDPPPPGGCFSCDGVGTVSAVYGAPLDDHATCPGGGRDDRQLLAMRAAMG
jgi:hypothetical protein